MPYVISRAVPYLNLEIGDELKHAEGSLPEALKFDAVWVEDKDEAELDVVGEPEPKAKSKK